MYSRAVFTVACRPAAHDALAPWRQLGMAGAARTLHKGHVGATLEKLNLPRHAWLKEVDQAPEKSNIRTKKDKFLRELGHVHGQIQGLFKDQEEAKREIQAYTSEEIAARDERKQRREDVNETLRMYRLLRPDAPPFYEEDSMLTMQAKMSKKLLDERPADALVPEQTKYGDPFKAYLPVVNQRAFLLALESIVASLADDIETMCLLVGISDEALPHNDDPLRFMKVLDTLFGAFPLKKDPSYVDSFMEESWPRLCNLLPEEVSKLPRERVADWLRGHLRRVRLNQRRHQPKIFLHQAPRFGDEEWYNFAEDFPYDDDFMPGEFVDERNLDFPLEQAAEYMRSLMDAIGRSPAAHAGTDASVPGGDADREDVPEQFQEFVWDLEKIGLRNWLKMDLGDLERYLPKGSIAELSLRKDGGDRKGTILLTEDDQDVAKLMLRCAARGRADLLDFDAVDPYKMLHNFPAYEIDAELSGLPAHAHCHDSVLEALVDAHSERITRRDVSGEPSLVTDRAWLSQGATVDELYRKELDFYRTAGPVEWEEDQDGQYDWKWRQPASTFWDARRQVYIQEQKGVDPNLELKEMRQHMLDICRMGSMVKIGRINYFRAIVVVGNGRGVYGFGVGFGNTPKEARKDAGLKALQNLDYVDMDPGRMLCTPCKGAEYKHTMEIIPRPIGRGLRANKKFLPLLYILGLDNCKVRFKFGKMFTRIKAIKRAMDMIISRRTLANMTGKRYALLVAPGDHWVHWPDRWFDEIRAPYDDKAKIAKLARKHALHFKRRGGNILPDKLELQPGWRKDNWARWNNQLERWLQHRRGFQPKNYNPALGTDGGAGSSPGA